VTTTILTGDCRELLPTLPEKSIQACVTSPPYFGLRSYLPDDHPSKLREIGQEPTPEAFVETMVTVFREVRRVLADDGCLFLNLGDSYNARPGQRKTTDAAGPKQLTNTASPGAPSRSIEGLAPKNLIGIPWRVALALQADGWILRQCNIWHKSNGMPESVNDRTTTAHQDAHFAVMPAKLAEICILAGSREGDTILDPFAGSGTTLGEANRLGRHGIGMELDDACRPMIERRTAQLALEVA
jgi:DNA modification methylase